MINKPTLQGMAVSIIITASVLVFINTLFSLSNISKRAKTIDGLASWWLAKAYFAEPQSPDVVILGSSQIAPLLGSDAYVYDRAVDITDDHRSYVLEHDLYELLNKHLRVFIGALPDAMISDQVFISKALFSKEYKPKLVAVAFSPRDFIDNYFSSEDSTEAFTFFSKYTDPFVLRNSLEKTRTQSCKPKSIRVNDSSDEPSLHLGKPFQRISAREIIIYSKDRYLFKNDMEEYKQRYKNPLSLRLNMQMSRLDSLLNYLTQQEIRVIAFNCPISAANKKLLPDNFWKYYDEQISEICRKHEVDYISADKVVLPFQDNEFIDGIHLNLVGGVRWSRPVAVYIANRFRLRLFQDLLTRADKCLL